MITADRMESSTIIIKTHLSQITPSDDFVFFGTGGKSNQYRRLMTGMNRLIDEKQQLWERRKDRGKKYSKRAFLEEHLLPYVRPAYACARDGTLRLLSEDEIRGKLDEILKKRVRPRKSGRSTRSPRRAGLSADAITKRKNTMQVEVVFPEEPAADVSEENDNDSDPNDDGEDETEDYDDDNNTAFGSLGNINFDDCFTAEDETGSVALVNDGVWDAGTAMPRTGTFVFKHCLPSLVVSPLTREPSADVPPDAITTTYGPLLARHVSLDPPHPLILAMEQQALQRRYNNRIHELQQAKLNTVAFLRRLFGDEACGAVVPPPPNRSVVGSQHNNNAMTEVQHWKELYDLLVLLQRRLAEHTGVGPTANGSVPV